MNFVKSLLVVSLFAGAQVHGMQNKSVKLSQSDITKVIGYAWENQNTVWAALGKFVPVDLVRRYLESDLYGAKKIKNFVFEDESEYRNAKWGAYLATGAYVFKSQIINAGVKETLYNKVAKVLGLSFFIGKAGSLFYNYMNSKNNTLKETKIAPVAPIKEKANDDETIKYIENLKTYNRSLSAQVEELKTFVAKIGAPTLNLQNVLDVLTDKSTQNDYENYGTTLSKQKEEYIGHIKKYLPSYKAGSKISSFKVTSIALGSFLSLYALNSFLANAIK